MWKTERAVGTVLDYHHDELRVALDASHPAHCLPVVEPHVTRVLDVGCGMVQSVLALRLDPGVEAWGVDIDPVAISAGQQILGSNIHLEVGSGERLPFANESFDFVFSRVALPYMIIPDALAEIRRVLRSGGRFWTVLHPP